MRRGYAFLILSLTGLCGAVALPAKQDEPKAEDVFRNITTLKGTKASDIIPSMQFMSDALKVKCDFCHTGDRSSDEKKAKNSAREMIELQRSINKEHFNGKNTITCATCHGGHIRPISVPPVQGVEVRPRRSDTVKPQEVLAAYGKAVGADSTHVIAGLTLKGTNIATKEPVETHYAGTHFAVSMKSSKGAITQQGFDGKTPWMTGENGIIRMPLQFASRFVNGRAIYIGPDTLPKLEKPTGATAQIEGKDQLVVSGATADKVRVTLFFDKTTSLLSRVSLSYPTILGNITQINDYSDYKKVNGVELPTTIGSHSAEGDEVVHYRSLKVEKSIDANVFAPPAK